MSHADGTPKVQILRDLGVLIDSEIEIEVMQARIESPEAQDVLAGVDVVVGCVDHDGPRFVLNEFCCKHGLPLIDAASDTMPEKDKVIFGGRVCVATPATGCLMCLEVLDQNELQEYYASPEQRAGPGRLSGPGWERTGRAEGASSLLCETATHRRMLSGPCASSIWFERRCWC